MSLQDTAFDVGTGGGGGGLTDLAGGGFGDFGDFGDFGTSSEFAGSRLSCLETLKWNFQWWESWTKLFPERIVYWFSVNVTPLDLHNAA